MPGAGGGLGAAGQAGGGDTPSGRARETSPIRPWARTAWAAAALAAAWSAGCDVTPQPIGSACTQKEDCLASICLTEKVFGADSGWAGGYCTVACGDGCPFGSVCVGEGDSAWCVATCEGPQACREGYVCDSSLGACVPDCRTSAICTDSESCDPVSGECVLDPVGETACEEGDTCDLATECPVGATACGCRPGALGFQCVPLCTVDADCPPGIGFFCSASGQCMPPPVIPPIP